MELKLTSVVKLLPTIHYTGWSNVCYRFIWPTSLLATVEEGVFRGAKEYYEIFDHSLNAWINEQKGKVSAVSTFTNYLEYSRRNTLQPKYTNIPGSNGYDSSTNGTRNEFVKPMKFQTGRQQKI